MTSPSMIAYRCSSCALCFVAVDEPVEGDLLCTCGAPLSPRNMPRGRYELRSPLPDDAPVTVPELAPIAEEHDLGYGSSHGYDPTHGGPTGPGDAPANAPASPV